MWGAGLRTVAPSPLRVPGHGRAGSRAAEGSHTALLEGDQLGTPLAGPRASLRSLTPLCPSWACLVSLVLEALGSVSG